MPRNESRMLAADLSVLETLPPGPRTSAPFAASEPATLSFTSGPGSAAFMLYARGWLLPPSPRSGRCTPAAPCSSERVSLQSRDLVKRPRQHKSRASLCIVLQIIMRIATAKVRITCSSECHNSEWSDDELDRLQRGRDSACTPQHPTRCAADRLRWALAAAAP